MFRNRKISLFILALVALFGLVAAAPRSAYAAVDGCKQTHTVVSGEYLSKIAAQYGTTYTALATLNKLADPNLIYVGQVLCVSVSTSGNPTSTPTSSGAPSGSVRVWAGSAVEDKSVTLKGKSLDTSSTYTIYLSNYKKTGSVEYLAGYAKTGSDGTFSTTFTLPKALIDISLIRIRAINSRGDQTINWYINTTGSSALGGAGSSSISIAIDDVKEGDWVKITASNLPANVTFHVFIAKGDSSGPIYVGNIRSTNGGKVTATFDLPTDYLDRTKLEIQLENESVQMEAARDFDND